ncbi:MAG: hypothetical protein V1779_03660 [bacterium]
MESTYIATYKEGTLILDNDLPVKPLSRVRIKVELPDIEKNKTFLDTAMSQKFTAPEDWSEKVDDYLYGEG